jgi:nitrate reductase NapD
VNKNHAHTLDRRAFLNAGRTADAKEPPDRLTEIASIVVQARPDRLSSVAGAIKTLPGTSIHASDPRGKLVVVIEASCADHIGTILNTISMLPGVLTAGVVFQGSTES